MGAGELETRNCELPRGAACADDDVRGSHSRSVVALDHVRVDEASGTGVLVDGHAGLLELVAQEPVPAHLAGDLANAGEQPPIVERGLAGIDSVTRELPRLPHQPRRVGQGPDRHRPVIRGHSPELVARYERRSSSESCRAQRRHDAGGPGADHGHIVVVCACGLHFVVPRSPFAVVIGATLVASHVLDALREPMASEATVEWQRGGPACGPERLDPRLTGPETWATPQSRSR